MSHPTANPTAGDPFANPSTSPDRPPALPDLPPVEAPSAGFVVQLFVIPAAVVVVVIIVWLLFGKLAGGERDADGVCPAAPAAARQLAVGLRAGQPDPERPGDRRRPEAPRRADRPPLPRARPGRGPQAAGRPHGCRSTWRSTLGAFRTLEAQTQSGQVVDPIDPLARALGPKFDKADPDRRGGQPGQAGGAGRRQARRPPRRQGPRRDGRGRRTPRSARSPSTPSASSAAPQAEQVLRDRIRSDEDRFTRYNAAVALGRRGDPAAESTLREMLSTADLDKVVQVDPETEEQNTPAARQNSIETIQLEALDALRTSLGKSSPQLARSLRPEVEKLTTSGLVSVRNQATEILHALDDAK